MNELRPQAGMHELAVAHTPVRYRELVANPQPERVPPRRRREEEATRRAWTVRGHIDPGERPDLR